MGREFKGRAVLSGNITGESVVTHQGLNPLASFQMASLNKNFYAPQLPHNPLQIGQLKRL